MQSQYEYELVEPEGQNFSPLFIPELTPEQMLELGVFGGKYLNGSKSEFREDWFLKARLSEVKDISLNYFSVDASQPLSEWQKKGGLMHRILADGFNGIVDIIWGDEHLMKTCDR